VAGGSANQYTPMTGLTLDVQISPTGTGSWTTHDHASANNAGNFAVSHRRGESADVRILYPGSAQILSSVSPTIHIAIS
jgi:hypothetical protein